MSLLARLGKWAWPAEVREVGVLGINRRNSRYILATNPRERYPRVDDKLATKAFCRQGEIPVPETYAVLERHGDVRCLEEVVRERPSFVLKPCRGAGGRGIAVVASHDGETFLSPGGCATSLGELRYHASTILSGLYSLGGRPDQAVVEERLVCHPTFERIAVGGTPDIRIVLYRGVPVLGMIRLPTEASRGRANLHQGAVAAGIDLTRGLTGGGVWLDRRIADHPDTGVPIAGFEIPGWSDLLTAAARLADVLDLGYVGADFVVDASRGPVVLEANARPGLAIQTANGRGLRRLLDQVDAQPPGRLATLEERLALSRELAGEPEASS